jgi:Ca2+-binding EF-hand superfamily protein
LFATHVYATTSLLLQKHLSSPDHDNDGTISFAEFVLLVVCMAVPEKDVEAVFRVIDTDNNGVVDDKEFSQVRR